MRRETFPFTLVIKQTINANDRLHHHAKAKLTADLRRRGAAMWAQARALGVEPMERAEVTAWVTWPDARRRDDANLYPTVKALIDGMTSGPNHKRAGEWVGILPDDDAKHLPALTFRRAGVERKLNKPSPQVRIELAFEDVAA